MKNYISTFFAFHTTLVCSTSSPFTCRSFSATFTDGITGVAAEVMLTILCGLHIAVIRYVVLPGPCAAASNDLTVAITSGVLGHVIDQHLNDSNISLSQCSMLPCTPHTPDHVSDLANQTHYHRHLNRWMDVSVIS